MKKQLLFLILATMIFVISVSVSVIVIDGCWRGPGSSINVQVQPGLTQPVAGIHVAGPDQITWN